MADETWYHEMSAAMKERDRALTALARWQQSLAEAEAKIQALRESDAGDEAQLPDKPEEAEPTADWPRAQ